MAVASPVESFAGTSDFARAARKALTQTPAGVDERFHLYHGVLLDDRGLNTWVRAKKQLFDLIGGVRGRTIVDAGSGFGMVSHLLACWGARRVFSVELYGPVVNSHRLILDAHFRNLCDRVLPLCSDVSRLPLAERSVDVVLSIEAISHYYDVPAFFDECARVLRPGGYVLISDGNNGANPKIRKHIEQLWQRLEFGPEGVFGDYDVRDPMVSRRERVLHEAFPALPPDRVRQLAEATSGWDTERIITTVQAHLRGGPAPASYYRKGDCPREPVWGYWHEQLFDPRDLARGLKARGFRSRAVPHFGGAANDLVLAANFVLRALPTFRFARAYRVVARRT